MLISQTSNLRPAAWLLAAVSLIVAAPPAPGQALPAGVEKVASVEGITEYRFPNGLRVLLFPDPTKSNITVNVTYMVGSRHEDYGETGMAHLLEHLMFKGSKKHPNIMKELQDRGARPNGTTWFDRTNYFETFTASEENLDWALSLEADRMVNSFIAQKDLDSEMTVVRNELEAMENDPAAILQERIFSTAYLWHNYGKSTIGARSDLENVPIERLQAFYRHFYQPDNAVLVVAGRIDEGKALAMAHKHFGPIPKPERQLRRTYTAEPAQDGERAVTLRRVGDVQAVGALWHVPPGSHEEFPAMDMAMDMLGDAPSGRLYRALIDTKKAAQVSAYAYQLRDPGVVLAMAQVRLEQPLEPARKAMLDTVDEIRAKPFTEEELERQRTKWLRNYELMLNNSEHVALNLSEWQAMGDWRLMFVQRDRIKNLTLAQVQKAAERYLIEANRTVGVFIPDKAPVRAEIPPAPDVAALVRNYQGQPTVAQGEEFDASPGNIDQRTVRADLEGGLKLSFLEKKTRGGQVQAALALHFGDEQSLKGQDMAAAFAGLMLMRGTVNKTRQQIRDEIDRLKAQVMVTGGAGLASARITATRENLPAAIALAAEMLKQPSFPAEEFEKAKQERLAQLESMKSEPQMRAVEAIQKHLMPYSRGDARYVETVEEQIESIHALTLDRVKEFHQGFYGASNGEAAIIGDFDAEAAKKQLAELFGGWKSPKPFTRLARSYHKAEAKAQTLEFADKANAMWVAGMQVKVNDTDADYPALLLGNFILGGGGVNSRLFARIRGKEGLSYGVGSNLQVMPKDDASVFFAFAICAPENAPKVEASFRDELKNVLEKGYTPAEVEAAKKSWMQGRQVSRANDGELIGRINNHRFWNRTMAFDSDLEAKVMALTAEQIRAAMVKHFDPAGLSIVRAGDFKKKSVAF
jgi:zinc protease